MVQQETLSPPVQLAAEGVQLVVWLLAENQTCTDGGTDGGSLTLRVSESVCESVCMTLAVACTTTSAGSFESAEVSSVYRRKRREPRLWGEK